MSTTVFLGIMLAAVLAAFLWMLSGPRGGESRTPDPETDAAEDEVRDVDAFTSPEDAEEEMPDWGPGAPRP